MLADFSFDEEHNTYYVLPTNENFAAAVVSIINGTLEQSCWDEVVDSAVALSKMIAAIAGDGYSLAILNPTDINNYLLLISDGAIVYDFMKK